jgi:hypothetical protein
MRAVEFVIALPPINDVPQFAAAGERLGFDYVCSGERVMFHGPITN